MENSIVFIIIPEIRAPGRDFSFSANCYIKNLAKVSIVDGGTGATYSKSMSAEQSFCSMGPVGAGLGCNIQCLRI